MVGLRDKRTVDKKDKKELVPLLQNNIIGFTSTGTVIVKLMSILNYHHLESGHL